MTSRSVSAAEQDGQSGTARYGERRGPPGSAEAHRRPLPSSIRFAMASASSSASNRFEPSRRLGESPAEEPDDHRAERSSDEQPAPSLDTKRRARHQDAPEQSGRWNTEETERVHPRGVASPEARWKKFAQIGVDERQLGTNADPGEEARDDQHRGIHAECANKRERGVDREVQQERRSPATAIGKPSQHGRADEHADKSGTQGCRKPQAIQRELLRQDRPEDTGQENVEEIEKGPDAGNEGHVPVGSRRRQSVQPRRNRNAWRQRHIGSVGVGNCGRILHAASGAR